MRIRETNDGLVRLAEGLWTVEHHRRAAGIHVRLRMNVVRLAGGGLWLHSPVPLDDRLAAQLSALGPVEHIVAPNRFHHLFAGPARERFPRARLWGAPGLPEKRKDLGFDAVLAYGPGDASAAPFGPDLEMVFLAGTPTVNEHVFLHVPSRSLLCTDSLFHIRDEETLLAAGLYRAMGVWKKPAQSRTWRLWTRDRQAARAAAERVLAWAPGRVVMAHGDVLEEDATGALARAMSWLSPRPRSP